jgi:MFS family permease
MPNGAASTGAGEWRAGWPMVLAAAFGLGATSLYFYSLGLMVPRLNAEFGWTPAQITLGPVIISAINLLAASRVGALVDRIGARRVALPGFVAFCLALAGLGLAGPHLWTWYALWAVLAFSFVFTAPSVWTAFLVGAFDKSRALAISIALCALGLTSFLTPLVVVWAADFQDWRLGYAALGLGMLVLGGPVLFFTMPRGRSAAAAKAEVAAAAGDAPLPGIGFSEAVRGLRFWMIAAASLLIGAGVGAMVVFLPSVGLSQGLTAPQVAAAASLIGLAAIGGRLLSGVLLDRLPVRIVGAAIFALPVIACAMMIGVRDVAGLSLVAVLLGLSSGGDFNVLAMLTSRYFGMRSYAAIYGQIAAAFNIGVGVGPPIAGLAYAATGNYGPVLIGLIVVFGLTAAVTAFLGREPA